MSLLPRGGKPQRSAVLKTENGRLLSADGQLGFSRIAQGCEDGLCGKPRGGNDITEQMRLKA